MIGRLYGGSDKNALIPARRKKSEPLPGAQGVQEEDASPASRMQGLYPSHPVGNRLQAGPPMCGRVRRRTAVHGTKEGTVQGSSVVREDTLRVATKQFLGPR